MFDGELSAAMKNVARLFVVITTATIFAASFLTVSQAQRRLGPFQHSTKEHQKSCNTCHKMPTRAWQSRRAFPDVATYPSHESCFGCHRQDVYSRGGAFCGSCHTVPTMRARTVSPFPAPGRQHQFKTIFPHSVHQDLIAANEVQEVRPAVAHFAKVSYRRTADDKLPEFNNCAICHKSISTEARLRFGIRPPTELKPLAEPQPDTYTKDESGKELRPGPAYFKDSPSGHASCFSCHSQNVKPIASDCAGCHKMTTPYVERPGIRRYSLKFDHSSPRDHAVSDCTSCHVRITRNDDLQKMVGADVPIVACRRCHGTQEDEPRWKRVIQAEVEDREKSVADKKPVFQCNYCHTTAIGRYEIPASHR